MQEQLNLDGNLPVDGGSYNDELFQGLDLSATRLTGAEFTNCRFVSCVFRESKFVDSRFEDCTFEVCDLSTIRPIGTIVADVVFRGCKLIGVNWSESSTVSLSVEFDECTLDDCVFPQLNLKQMRMTDCTARRADFSESNLSQADLSGTDFEGARFLNTNLSNADLSTATNYAIDVRVNNVKRAKFSLPEAVSLLSCLGITIVD